MAEPFITWLRAVPQLPLPCAGTPFSELEQPGPFGHVDQFHPAHLAQLRLLSPRDRETVLRFADDVIPPGWPEHEPEFPSEMHLNYDQISYKDPAADVDATVRAWLYQRGIPFARRVFVLHDRRGDVLQTSWSNIVRYWDVFDRHCGFASYVIDHTKTWGLCFHHENFVLFGTRRVGTL